jgi:hypothetical protein
LIRAVAPFRSYVIRPRLACFTSWTRA